jgi:hypothetical protein
MMHLLRFNRLSHPNEPEEPEGEGLSTYHLGGGWYEINGTKVQGKESAMQLLEGDTDAN